LLQSNSQGFGDAVEESKRRLHGREAVCARAAWVSRGKEIRCITAVYRIHSR
jgi:hypothetical protein